MPHIVMHICRRRDERPVVVGPLQLVSRPTVGADFGRVANYPRIGVQKRRGATPVPHLLSPLRVGVVPGVSSQSSSQLRETSV